MEYIRRLTESLEVWQFVVVGVVTFVVMRKLRRYFTVLKKYTAEGKTILITGANTGIGRAAAIEFAKRGGRVILACRDTEKAKRAAYYIRERTNKGLLVIKQLDLSSQDSVRKFANDILATEDRLDVLVNNAGVFGLPYGLTEDGIETTFAVNHLSHFLLTNMLLDLMRKKKHARIITVTSMLYARGIIDIDDIVKGGHKSSSYSQSKLANIMCANVLSSRLAGSGITVNSVSPGMVKTDLARHKIGESFMKNLMYETVGRLLLKTPEQGCEMIISCALDPDFKSTTGKLFRNGQKLELNDVAKDESTALRLWDVCMDLTNLH
ncbi:retinol dehydrogenase 14-like [Styela clava]